MKKINVRLGTNSYPILIGRGMLPKIGTLLKPLRLGSKILVVTNRRVAALFLKPIRTSLKRAGYEVYEYRLGHGSELDKSQKSLFELWKKMAELRLERNSTVLALGGGVVGDLAGFAASTYMRGIHLIQVPTTLLAQVDAAIGGKTAIDLPAAKNIAGTFYQPKMVISDMSTLETGLKDSQFRRRELKNGFAEIIKYGVIQDPKLFGLLEKKLSAVLLFIRRKKSIGNRELSFLEEGVWRSARVKAKVVGADERETKGKRMILNYGHTFAHAFEAAKNYRLPHGEAVALGMICAAHLARNRGIFTLENEWRQNCLIQSAGLPTQLRRYRFRLNQVLGSMLLDKKRSEGKLRFILPVAIGRVKAVRDVSISEVKKTLKELGVS